jgi:hypothetical protein
MHAIQKSTSEKIAIDNEKSSLWSKSQVLTPMATAIATIPKTIPDARA